MDSLPTGSFQSWLIIAAGAASPVILLFFVHAIGRVRRLIAQGRPAGEARAGPEEADGGVNRRPGLDRRIASRADVTGIRRVADGAGRPRSP